MNILKVLLNLKKYKIMSDDDISTLVDNVLTEHRRAHDRFNSYVDTPVVNSWVGSLNTKNYKNPSVKDVMNAAFVTFPNETLSLQELFMLQSAAREKYLLDPIWKGAVDSFVDYVIGTGTKVSTPVPELTEKLKIFRNNSDFNLRESSYLRSLFLDGELFLVLFFDKYRQNAFVRKISPKTVAEIETNPLDEETIYCYRREYNVLSTTGVTVGPIITQYLKDIDYDRLKELKIIPYNGSVYASKFHRNAVCLHIKLNEIDQARGIPPATPILKYLKKYEDFINDRMTLIHEKSKVVWLKKISGRSEGAEIATAPRGGIMLKETDQVSYRSEKPNFESTEAKEDALNLLYYIGSAIRYPLHVLNQRTDQQVYACHDMETELLTKRGWFNYSDLEENDIAGTVNPKTGIFEWQKINGFIDYQYQGIMYHSISKSSESMVTPNHDLFIQPFNKNIKQDQIQFNGFKKYRADSVPTSKFWINTSLKFTDFEDNSIPDFITDDQIDNWLKLIAAYIGDGSLWVGSIKNKDIEFPRYKISISFQKEKKIDYFFKTFGELGLDMWFDDEGMLKAHTCDEEFCKWVEVNCGKGSYNKKIPNFIFNLPKSKQEIFFEALIQTDGSIDLREGRTNIRYFTTSKKLSDDVMLLGLQLGYRVTIDFDERKGNPRVIRGKETEFKSDKYIVKFIKREYELLSNTNKINYSGKVWCINVDNGIMVTRRNGKIAIHGNSIRKADTPFTTMINGMQTFLALNMEKLYRSVLLNTMDPNKKYDYPEYSEDAVINALECFQDMMGRGEKISDVMNKVQKTVEEGQTMVSKTIKDIPITQDFPQIIWQDPKELAEVLKMHAEIGIASKSSLSTKAGYSWPREFSRLLMERAAFEPEEPEMGETEEENKKPNKKLNNQTKGETK